MSGRVCSSLHALHTLTESWFAVLTRILKVIVPPLDAASGMETLRYFIVCWCIGCNGRV